jgi:hypothetical protein
MGFSRITLGMDRFRSYAAQAITNSAIEKMLWPDFEPLDANANMSPAKKVEVRAEQLWEDFLENSGLYERNPRNDIIDALRPIDDSVFGKFASAVIDRAGGRDSALTAAQWETKILEFFTSQKAEFSRQQILQVAELAASWASDIQDKIVRTVTNIIATDGYAVAIRLIRKLRDVELEFLIKDELPTDAKRSRNLVDEIRSPLARALGTKSKISKQDSEITEGVKKTLSKGASFLGEAGRIDLAIELLIDLDANFLAGLLTSMEEASKSLRSNVRISSSATDSGEDVIDISTFPKLDGGVISAKFAPANTEQSLIDYKDFPKLLEQYAQDVLDGDQKSSWKPRLIERAIKGISYDPSGNSEAPDLIKIEPRWVPINSLARTGEQTAAQSAGFNFIVDIPSLLARTTEMLTFKSGSLSKAINMGLRTYIEDTASGSLRDARRKDFKAALVNALKYCTPMVEEDPVVLGIVHPGATAGGRNTYFTPIPLEGSPLQADSVQTVLQYDPGNLAIQKSSSFTSSSSIKQIEFYSTLTNARNPVVFNTLMAPIASDWNGRINDEDERRSFWTFRRTKPLVDSVPISQEGLQKLVTGWFALAFTGNRKIDATDSNKGPKVSVFSVKQNSWTEFPNPLLGLPDDYTAQDYLPAVLLSLSLALVHVNERKSLEPLFAYQAMQDAGSADQNFGYRALIKRYVQSLGDSVNEQEARESLKLEISELLKQFENDFAILEKTQDPFSSPQILELKALILQGLATLRDGTSGDVAGNSNLRVSF